MQASKQTAQTFTVKTFGPWSFPGYVSEIKTIAQAEEIARGRLSIGWTSADIYADTLHVDGARTLTLVATV
jgi:hypothetical protein